MPRLSVIVPVYNAEKYLAECVESILNQTIQDLELILVDDGSTDSSPAMCDAFAQQDSRVKVIHKPNGRASSARNAGIPCVAIPNRMTESCNLSRATYRLNSLSALLQSLKSAL